MLFKKLFSLFVFVLLIGTTFPVLAQNKAITEVLVANQDTSLGANFVRECAKHLYLQLRLGKIQGYADISRKIPIKSFNIPQIERYYQKRLDSVDGLFIYEQWDIHSDSIKIFTGGISLIITNIDTVSKRKKGQELSRTELIYFPYDQLMNDFQNTLFPVNMNGVFGQNLHEIIQERNFNGHLVFFEGRWFNEKNGQDFTQKITSKHLLPTHQTSPEQKKMEYFLYANHEKFDPMGQVICSKIYQYFLNNPENYFNLFPNANIPFWNPEFQIPNQIIVRKLLKYKNELVAIPQDIILLYNNGATPDTLSFSDISQLNIKVGELTLDWYLGASSPERLFQVNASPIHQKCALIMAKILDDPKNWNQLMSLYHSYEAYLD
jgi:hypothetical protein